MKYILPTIFIIGITACSQTQTKKDTKTLDFGFFIIETPKSWTPIKKNGIDSYVGEIAIDSRDTLSFDLGWYSNKLTEPDPTFLDSSALTHIDPSLIDTSEVIFVKNRMTIDMDKFRKNNVTWDTIDGHIAKIVFPRQSGIGTTGVYIDSLWVAGSSVDRFNLYGQNLSPDNEKKVLEAIKTLMFHKK